MALYTGRMLVRRGNEVNYNPDKLMPGEWALSTDKKIVRICVAAGICIRMATYDAFEKDMAQIEEILKECQSIQEAVIRINTEVNKNADAVAEYTAQAKTYMEAAKTSAANAKASENASKTSETNAKTSETNAKASENAASGSATIATNKALEAEQSASESANSALLAGRSENNAKNSEDNADYYSKLSKSYAIGDTGERLGEDTDNSKYYKEQAAQSATKAEEAAERASAVVDVGIATAEKAGLVKTDGDTLKIDSAGTVSVDYDKFKEKELDILNVKSEDSIHLADSTNNPIVEFSLYGKATKNGTPTPDAPIDIEIAGSSGSVVVKSCGKNLLENIATTQTISGVTCTVNEDGSITLNGTKSAVGVSLVLNSRLDLVKGSSYIITDGNNATGLPCITSNVVKPDGTSITDGFTTYDNNRNIYTCEEDGVYIKNVRLWLGTAEVTYNNLTLYPMIRRCDENGNPIGNATYEPYKETTATIPTPNGLAGIPVDSGGNYTDSDGQQWICDEIVKYADGSGERIQKVKKVVLDGTENWYASSSIANLYYMVISDANAKIMPMISDRYINTILGNNVSPDKTIKQGASSTTPTSPLLFIKDSSFETVDELKEFLTENNVTCYYILAEPIITPLTAEEIAEIEKLQTFYPVTNISNDADCGMKVSFVKNNFINTQTSLPVITYAERDNLKSGDSALTLFGKIKKWFADLKTVAFSGSYNDLSNKPTIPTIPTPVNNLLATVAGQPLDATQGKALDDKITALNDSLGDIGSTLTTDIITTSVESLKWVKLVDLTIPAGKYNIIRRAKSSFSTSAKLIVAISASSEGNGISTTSGTGVVSTEYTTFSANNSEKTVSLYVRQDSGANVNITGFISAIKIGS